jgi:DNA-binding NtrC family response regulator
MTGSRLALVADDPKVAAAIGSYLKEGLGQSPLVCSFESIRDHLARDTDGLLLMVAVTPAHAEPLVRLVQEIYLRKLPPILFLVEAATLAEPPALAALEPYVAHRVRWPDQAEHLLGLVKERLHRLRGFPSDAGQSAEGVIRRRLLSMTPSLVPLVERLALAASHDVTVLLTGETGTGKTFVARLLHDCSPRKAHPFLTVPCGAQPANLIESAFFGHVKGAFTGADRPKVGKFAAAGQGTLLLDEIDTLPLEQQAGLLRVIETGEYEPVGSNETQHCHARLVVCSNWDLEEAVARGLMREDLYYRLNVISFHLPPLRERVQDIAPLVRGTAARYNAKFKKDLFDVSPEAMAALETFAWPGNIRQLENVVQQAVLVSSGPELLPEHLPPAVREQRPAAGAAKAGPPPDSLEHSVEVAERSAIQRALANHNYSRTRAAQALGISRVTLFKKMKKYGLMKGP